MTEQEQTLSSEELKELETQNSVTSYIRSRFESAKTAKRHTEDIHLKAFNAYRGIHDSEARARIEQSKERNPYASSLFIKITKTKTQAAYGQILEILSADGKFPINVRPTPIPEDIPEVVHFDIEGGVDSGITNELPYGDVYGFEGDGQEIEPGATRNSLLKNVSDKLKGLLGDKDLKVGNALDRQKQKEVYLAEEAAKATEKLIQDQLSESHAQTALRAAALECAMLGTGVIKGPVTYIETIHKWEKEGEEVVYAPVTKLSPKISHVSSWGLYPDPNATCNEDLSYLVERHLLNNTQIRALMKNPGFSKDAIARLLMDTSEGHAEEHWERDLTDATIQDMSDRREVLEYWGSIDKELADALGIVYDEDTVIDQVNVNIWTSNNIVLRAVVNPFTPERIPYYFIPYEEHPYQIWGIGIPENMEETQSMINGHMRMAIDNLKLAGNIVFEVDERSFRPGENFQMYPGKVFRKSGGAPGQSIFGTTFPNTAESHLSMVRTAQQLADQQTLPSVAHGQSGVSGVGRTSSGMSMLMQAAMLSIKTVIKNFDHYLFKPLGDSLYQWNLQFNQHNVDFKGDVKIDATGTAGFVRKEMETQKLISFGQFAGANPATAPMVNWEQYLKDITENMGLNTDRLVNDPTTALLYAQIIGEQQQQPQEQQPQEQRPENPGPGQEGFTGNTEQQLLQELNRNV